MVHFTPRVFSELRKLFIISDMRESIRVSFSAPNLQDSSWRFFCVLNRRFRAVRGRFCLSLQQFISSVFRPYFRRLLTNNRLFSGMGKTIWCNKPVFTLVQQYTNSILQYMLFFSAIIGRRYSSVGLEIFSESELLREAQPLGDFFYGQRCLR